jgi:hypothetical protein
MAGRESSGGVVVTAVAGSRSDEVMRGSVATVPGDGRPGRSGRSGRSSPSGSARSSPLGGWSGGDATPRRSRRAGRRWCRGRSCTPDTSPLVCDTHGSWRHASGGRTPPIARSEGDGAPRTSKRCSACSQVDFPPARVCPVGAAKRRARGRFPLTASGRTAQQPHWPDSEHEPFGSLWKPPPRGRAPGPGNVDPRVSGSGEDGLARHVRPQLGGALPRDRCQRNDTGVEAPAGDECQDRR